MKTKKVQYYKHPNNSLFACIDSVNKKRITVDLYSFDTAIRIDNSLYIPLEDELKICSKIEFDKAFYLALALITNKETNTDEH